jgi:S-adenosylhomocysteine hydrolase
MTQTLQQPRRASADAKLEFKIANMDDREKFQQAAEWGRKEIMLAEQEMPGLMAVRAE